ncbi:MAG: tRNA pseudouridine(13) synthase TruD, partial [Myxococcales bacterium]|nr:tRNA pseudouridine(13) synthase TruD [Myxococcales bacterium]
ARQRSSQPTASSAHAGERRGHAARRDDRGRQRGGASDEPGATSTLEVAFSLPGGAYATTVMREIMKDAAPRVDADPEGA